VTQPVILRKNVDEESMVVPFAADETVIVSAEDIARDFVHRSKRHKASEEHNAAAESSAASAELQELLQRAHASVNRVDFRFKAMRRERANQLGLHRHAYSFANMQWVSPTVGLYTGDLALVFFPSVGGKPWPSHSKPRPEYVQVLVVPRWDLQDCFGGSTRKRKRTRPPQRIIKDTSTPPHQFVGCNSFYNHTLKKRVTFYYGLVLLLIPANSLRPARPYSTRELQPFADANLDVRAWKRRLSQETLRSGDLVRVIGAGLDGCVAMIDEIHHSSATIKVIDESESERAVSEVVSEVDIRHLERHFELSDKVRCVSDPEGEERIGFIIDIVEFDEDGYEGGPLRVLTRDNLSVEKVKRLQITVVRMPENETVRPLHVSLSLPM
jgi:hypothetical protein